jgi:plasmid stability protein
MEPMNDRKITIRNVPADIYKRIRIQAAEAEQSINARILAILKEAAK